MVPKLAYYLTFSRMPTLGLDAWRAIFDSYAEDGAEEVVLWIGGGFRSRKFPVTWQYNASHANVQHDFVGDLIDYAHTLGVRVLLGFTPFTYDGVNQYPLIRPDLKALRSDGRLAREQGIHCWGYGLCPAKEDARRFMNEYVRELYFDFYPNADGLLVESSDIDICAGGTCATDYFTHEYEFTRQLSEEVWKHNADATIIVYPHYFDGLHGVVHPYDPRWSLVFTPHSAFVSDEMVSLASSTYYSDLFLISKLPSDIRDSLKLVRDNKIDWYYPSNEFFTFVPWRAEMREPNVVGRAMHPFGLEVIPRDVSPYGDPLVLVNRLAVQEFRADPDLPLPKFWERAAGMILGGGVSDRLVEDLGFLHTAFYRDKTLFTAAPQADPRVTLDRITRGELAPSDLAAILDGLVELQAVADRFADLGTAAGERLAAHARHALALWTPEARRTVAAHLGS